MFPIENPIPFHGNEVGFKNLASNCFLFLLLQKLAEQYDSIKFIKVDVDENSETAEAYQVAAMPTFKFFKDGIKEDELTGANVEKLKEKVEKFSK